LNVKVKKSTNYEDAINFALDLLTEIDIHRQSRRCNAELIGDSNEISGVALNFMGRRYIISLKDMDVFSADNKVVSEKKEETGFLVPIHYKVLMLHYFIYHSGERPKGDWISFQDIPDGLLYTDIYKARTSIPLSVTLGDDSRLLIDSARHLGGNESNLGGDISVLLEPFFGVPVGIVFWNGDENFPPEVNFLYDSSISKIFPAEDVVVLTQSIVGEIRKFIKG
jgi:hypothetical protein